MALASEHKLAIAVGVLVALGGALWYQNKKQAEEAKTYTAENRTADLPKLEITEEQTKAVDKITLDKPPGDAGKGSAITLEKQGEKWVVTAPVKAEANQTNVSSLLTNLKQLKITEAIDPSAGAYAKFGVADDKALHAVFYKGGEKIADMWFGDSGGRGQMTRLSGRDGVYAVKGYSSFLYDREVKDWRDRGLFKFEEDKVKSVEITNENGTFKFAKDKDKWTAKAKGPKDPAAKDLDRFDEAKLKQAIGAYKALNADNFGSDKKPADVGLEKPTATITFTLADGAKKTLHVGSTAEGTSRWAKVEGSEEIVSIGSWAADYALAKADKFQSEKKDKDAGAAEPPPDMPMGMPGMPPMGMGEDPH